MGLRDSFKNALTQPSSIFLEGPMREIIEEVLANRGYVMPGDHRALENKVTQLEKKLERFDEIQSELTTLSKKLNMAMGAIQAATAQIAHAKSNAEQANQRATSASATAESAADAVTGLEDAFAALVERIGTQSAMNSNSLPNFALLDGSVSSLKSALADGGQDTHLSALLAAEEAGQARAGAIKVIRQRM